MTTLAQTERDALCDTLERVGPDAPTLCDPWRSVDLTAHLAVRERRPDAAAGIAVSALEGHSESVMQAYAARPWAELVGLVRSGPPWWSPVRIPAVDGAVNLGEFLIHHEDLLRAESAGPQRELATEVEESVWRTLVRLAPLMFRRSPAGVVLVSDLGRTAARKPSNSHATVVLRGAPMELLLTAYGRARVADVDIRGADPDVAALLGSPLGLGG